MRRFPTILILALALGCAGPVALPDLSSLPGGPKPVFLLDEIESLEPASLTGSIPDGASVRLDTVKIGNTVARALAAFPTGAFKWTGSVPPGARMACLVGVGGAPVELFNVMGLVPPINRYGAMNAPLVPGMRFRLLVNGEQVMERMVSKEDFNRWTPINIDLPDHAGEIVELTFAAEGILPGTVLPYWGHPMILAPRENPRRIILLGIDTVAAGHVGWMGYDRDTTPNLDRLATRSTIFVDAHSPSPWTLPAFAAVLSGRPPGVTGADRNNRGLSEHEDMLAEVFRRAGFATAGFVTIPYLQERGFFQGNDHQWEAFDRPAQEALTEARNWFDIHRSQDVFVFIHLFDPHIPYRPPEKWAARYRDPGYRGPHANVWDLLKKDYLDPGVWATFDEAEQKQCEALYDAEIASMDEAIGEFFDWYEEESLLEETLLIVFSDHGEEFGEHGRWEHGHSEYEEQIHVPFFIHMPGQTSSRRIEGLVGIIDIYPTLLELFGVSSKTEPFGKSLVPVLEGGEPDPERFIFAESTFWGPEIKAVVTNRYKYILTIPTGEEELYDLVRDPAELNNIIAEEPGQVAELGSLMVTYVNDTQSGWHVRFLAGPGEPLSLDLTISSRATIDNPTLVEQIFSGSGPGLTIEDSFTCRLTLDLKPGDTVELRFSTTPETETVTFSGTIDGSTARSVLRLGVLGLPLDELVTHLAGVGVELEPIPVSATLSLAMDDPVIAFSFPNYNREESRGAFLWSVPAGLRAHAPTLTPDQEAALESVGYFFH